MSKLEILLKDVFTELYKSKLRYVLIRNYEELPYKISKDIDILMDFDDAYEIKLLLMDILKKHGFIYTFKSNNITSFTLIGTNGVNMKDEKKVIFHCVTHISINTSKLEKRIKGLSKKYVYEDFNTRVINLEGLYINILARKDEFLVLYMHYYKKRKDKYKSKILEFLKDKEINVWLIEHFGDLNLEEYIFDNGNSDQIINELSFDLWGVYNAKKYILTHLLHLGTNIIGYLKGKPIIYLSGPDGAGKTTIHANLINYYEKLNIKVKAYKTIHFLVARVTDRIRLKRGINKTICDIQNSHNNILIGERDRDTKKVSWRIRRYVGLIVALFDAMIIGRLVTYYYRYKGYIVIIETSPYDIFVKRHRPRFVLTEKIFIPLLPKPTLGFIMSADPKVIANRKPELTIDEIQDYYQRTNNNLKTMIKNNIIISINTNISPDKATGEIINKISDISIR